MVSLGDVRDNDDGESNRSLSKSFYSRTSSLTLPKTKYSGEGSEAAKCAKFLTTLSASLKAGDRRVYACWERSNRVSPAVGYLIRVWFALKTPNSLFLHSRKRPWSVVVIHILTSTHAQTSFNITIWDVFNDRFLVLHIATIIEVCMTVELTIFKFGFYGNKHNFTSHHLIS